MMLWARKVLPQAVSRSVDWSELDDVVLQASPLVQKRTVKRMEELVEVTSQDPMDVPRANALMRQLFRWAVIDPTKRRIELHWQIAAAHDLVSDGAMASEAAITLGIMFCMGSAAQLIEAERATVPGQVGRGHFRIWHKADIDPDAFECPLSGVKQAF